MAQIVGAAGPTRRQADWAAFYKNGPPKEVIVIDDDTPPPPSLSSSASSSSSSTHTAPTGHLTSSGTRYKITRPVMPPTTLYHPTPDSLSGPSSIPVPTRRVTRRANKRLPSTDLTHSEMSGQYAYADNTHAARVGQPANSHYRTAQPVIAIDESPAKKKRKSNADLKYIQPVPQANRTVQYAAPQQNATTTNGNTVVNGPHWDDKEGHYIVTPGQEFTSRYEIIRLLGQGTFGKVVECMDRDTGRRCAIKIIRAIQKYRDASKIEARVLRTLKKSDPTNGYKCLHLNDCFDYRNHVCMVFDLLGQSIYDWLKDNQFCPFPPNQIQHFARQLLTSVAFLHRLRLIHTDLKPENILLANGAYKQMPYRKTPTSKMQTRRVLLDPEIRLIDFGSATFQDEHHSTVVCTRHYRAPEIILGLGWSYPCDIWSIGCILVEFLTGEALFQTHDNLEHLAMMQAVLGPIPDKLVRATHKSSQKYFVRGQLDYPNDDTKRNSRRYVKALKPLKDYVVSASNRIESMAFSQELRDLLRSLLAYDPEERITAAHALKHPYFSYVVDEDGHVLGKKSGSETIIM
ncbi:dual-specificity kinase [Entomortierella parvispora]|uniref:Dual-specificity kinase n=1 Tax=Entomortierella parvispora TaxID=205924 RepID=A0A9P3LXQ7_9FUNG|nr:dual-specificity kinase [Entomortierella parvispora]